MRLIVVALIATLVPFAGCLNTTNELADTDARVPFEMELADAAFDTDGPYSRTLIPGDLKALPMQEVDIESFDGTTLAAALWRPDVPEGTKVPVILMISPYWSSGLYNADSRTQEFFIEELVAHGYAFAKVANRGTSYSEGCMESMGPNEQKDMDSIVTFFGEQRWSTGSVGIIGVSYVGTTPWAAAQWGNPYLKTIVPISGVTSWYELGFRNGTAEPRAPAHMMLYWGLYGAAEPVATQEPQRTPQNLCEEPVWSIAAGPVTSATGEGTVDRLDEYWEVRDYRERVAENYNGSIFLIHGIRDWNVNIDMAVPFVTDLQAQGLEVKWLLGQWGHSWPDQASRGEHVRYDFAQVLKRWFDVHLKGKDLDTGPAVDVEDSHNLWRTEGTWPPADVNWTTYHLGDGVLSDDETPSGSAMAVNPNGAVDPIVCGETGAPLPPAVPGTDWRFSLGTLDEDLRFAGPVQLHATLTPHDPAGGDIYAELWEVSGDTWYRAAHGAMNLRFHKGGHEAQTITPGEPILALLEMYAADVLFKAGSEVVLRVLPDTPLDPCASATGGDAIQRPFVGAPGPVPLTLHWGDGASVLNLPIVERDVGDGKYPGQPE